jgi:hypothetical protein
MHAPDVSFGYALERLTADRTKVEMERRRAFIVMVGVGRIGVKLAGWWHT